MKCLTCNDDRVKLLPAIPSHLLREGFSVARAMNIPTVTGPIYRCHPCGRQFDQDDINRAARA